MVAADPGREFVWEVNNGWVWWGYTFEPENGGTRLTESWEFLPAGIAGFRERYGEDADAEIDKRRDAAKSWYPCHPRRDQEGRRSREIVPPAQRRPRILHQGSSGADFTAMAQNSARATSRLRADRRGGAEDFDFLGKPFEVLCTQAFEAQP